MLAYSDEGFGTYYIKPGGSFDKKNYDSYSTVILSTGNKIIFDGAVDTLYCNDLQYDYSKVGGVKAVLNSEKYPPLVDLAASTIHVCNRGFPISVQIITPLGSTVLRNNGFDELDTDLNALAGGIYFALVTSGSFSEIKKIVIIH